MSLGIVLDVAIGLAFTYLLLSIMVSGLQEICTNFISLRGKKLRSGIAALLAGIDKNGLPSTALFDKVFGHALISDLATKKLPSYVPARNFSMALFEALKKDGSQDPLFKQIEQGIASLPEGSPSKALPPSSRKQQATSLRCRSGSRPGSTTAWTGSAARIDASRSILRSAVAS